MLCAVVVQAGEGADGVCEGVGRIFGERLLAKQT